MKIVFVSNNYNHHERFFCEEIDKIPNVEFYFIQTQPMREERLKLGWGEDTTRIPFVVESYTSTQAHTNALDICNNADALIIGSAPYEFVAERVRKNKLTFFYAERLFRNGLWHMLYPPTLFTVLKRFIIPGNKSNFYMLCASGYTALDCHKICAFRGKYFKWGHFIEVGYPEGRKNKVDEDKLHLLWAGRFLELKHPDYAIRAAKTLKNNNIPFVLDIIGSGEQEENMRELIADLQLEDDVVMHGTMKPTEVRRYMEEADIYMFTSDFNEGWGAVLGESMTSGCAIVTSHGIGATPFLVTNGYNGLIYETGSYKSFENKVMKLAESKTTREKLSANAISTMLDLWNAKVGAGRFYQVVNALLTGNPIPQYEKGPMSKAELINNNWFIDDTV